MHWIDWLIVLLPLALVAWVGIKTQKYVKGVSDFLSAGRVAGRYVVCVAGGEAAMGWGALHSLGIDRVIADLYFTLPFDLGIIEARQKFVGRGDPTQGEVEEYGKVFIGEPYEIDCEASAALGLKTRYLDLIKEAKIAFDA